MSTNSIEHANDIVVGGAGDDTVEAEGDLVRRPHRREVDEFDQQSIIDSLGAEITRIVGPVSACMLLLVLLVSALPSDDLFSALLVTSSDAGDSPSSSSSSSIWPTIAGAAVTSLIFVLVVTLVTFVLVLLFYLRCTPCLKIYTTFSAAAVLAVLGGRVVILLLSQFSIPIDPITFSVLLFNFAAVGAVAVTGDIAAFPIALRQIYLVIIGVLVAYWFTFLPEWTTWALLIAMALYDLAAVLLPGGPLRLLVELAISRDEDIPALVYEARPVDPPEPFRRRRRRRSVWRANRDDNNSNLTVSESSRDSSNALAIAEEGGLVGSSSDVSAPLLSDPRLERRDVGEEEHEGMGLGSSGAIKLGLGDFIFYSVLVGRAAMYDYMTVYACYLAIIAGLGITLMLLAVYRKALPALPVSILLGVLFYVLTRVFLEAFVFQFSLNFLMF